MKKVYHGAASKAMSDVISYNCKSWDASRNCTALSYPIEIIKKEFLESDHRQYASFGERR